MVKSTQDVAGDDAAAALAVLAAEEAGKFVLVKFDADWRRKFYTHPEKLGASAAFHEVEAQGLAVGSTGQMRTIYSAAPDAPEYAEWRRRALEFDRTKQDALYVERDGSEPGAKVGREEAAKCLDYARGEVDRLNVTELVKALGA